MLRGAPNFRDVGGLATEDGRRLRTGCLFRDRRARRRRARSPECVFLHLPATDVGPTSMTCAQVGRAADSLEAELAAAGVRPDDRVMVVAENCPQHPALVLACSWVGAWSCRSGMALQVALTGHQAFLHHLTSMPPLD